MSIRLYEYMKNRYESTKPIRGRAVDTRPWDDRRRDKELIVQTTRVLDGAVVYGARLYDTTVLEVDPKGTLTFRCDDFVTPTTSKFIELVMRDLLLGGVRRRFNNLWVYIRGNMVEGNVWARIPRTGSMDITYNPDTDKYTIPEQTVTKRTTDTIKMKEFRSKAKGFMDYYRSLLKLSEGMVTAQFKADNIERVNMNAPWRMDDYVNLKLDGHDELQRLHTGRYFRMRFLSAPERGVLFNALTEGNEENYAPLLTWFANCADAISEGYMERVTFSNGGGGDLVSIPISISSIDRMVTQVLKEAGKAYKYAEVVVTEPTKDDGDIA